jgi:hypothetical protein
MTEIEQELAALRHLWGGVYRITWNGQFHATHLASSEVLEASSSNELRALLLANNDQKANVRSADGNETAAQDS